MFSQQIPSIQRYIWSCLPPKNHSVRHHFHLRYFVSDHDERSIYVAMWLTAERKTVRKRDFVSVCTALAQGPVGTCRLASNSPVLFYDRVNQCLRYQICLKQGILGVLEQERELLRHLLQVSLRKTRQATRRYSVSPNEVKNRVQHRFAHRYNA
jgi:hypothetical protein